MKLNKLIKTFHILIKNVIILFEVQRKTESKNPQVLTTKNWKMFLLKCEVFDNKKIKIYQRARSYQLGIKQFRNKDTLK